jgi:hypothetical protein
MCQTLFILQVESIVSNSFVKNFGINMECTINDLYEVNSMFRFHLEYNYCFVTSPHNMKL